MIASFFIVMIGAATGYLQIKSLWKQNKKKDAFVFASILFTGVAFYTAYVLEFPFPSTYDVFAHLLGPINKPIEDWVKGG